LNQEREAVHQQYTVLYNKAIGHAQQRFDDQRKAVLSDMQALLHQQEIKLNNRL
jgi:hypothetical protein